MNKKTIKKLLLSLSFITIIAIIVLILYANNSSAIFFLDDDTRINTDIVDSYTIIKKNGNSTIYDKNDEQFKAISNILSSVETYHDENRIYLFDKKSSEHIVLKSKNTNIAFYPYCDKQPDGRIILILKDYCENRSTSYFLDNHDYLITTISEKDYYKIFS